MEGAFAPPDAMPWPLKTLEPPAWGKITVPVVLGIGAAWGKMT